MKKLVSTLGKWKLYFNVVLDSDNYHEVYYHIYYEDKEKRTFNFTWYDEDDPRELEASEMWEISDFNSVSDPFLLMDHLNYEDTITIILIDELINHGELSYE